MANQTSLPAVDIQSFAMRYGPKEVIKDLSFTVNKGEVFGLLGSNGAGKTTTIRTLLSLLEPSSGTLLVNGKRYTPAMAATVGYLPEERGLYRNEPVVDTMVYFAVMHGLGREEAKKRVLAYLERVGLGDKANERLVGLSNGQQQKVQLGVTILHEPALMILDEPTEALDPVNRSLLMNIINEQRTNGATVVLVTHRMEEVEQLCDRILLLKDGTSALYGTVDEVKNKFGTTVIALAYNGTLPLNDKLYTITKQLPHYAELAWREGVTADEVLRFLAGAQGLHLTTFDVRRPTLNEIFLSLYK
ncbi:MAG TPA: ATP-binding cassette domain-containing protein [Candidatus Paceibacterota bacterium]|nr:ATP-binding cassette domain-containing protein [Candidatus Paceibacterota bacterium]